jgi:enoyl-CoA hydratase/carnithine racemase
VSITFNRPDKLNALTFKMLEEVNHVLTRETRRAGGGVPRRRAPSFESAAIVG